MKVEFDELIQNIPAVFYRCKCDDDWTMYFISTAIEDITGYPANEFVLNGTRTYTSILHPDDLQDALDAVNMAVKKRESWEIEYRMITRDGREVWVAEKGIGIFSKSGDLKYLDGFISNITQRKQMESDLEDSRQQIYKLAYTDSVTGLANRNLFQDRIDQLLSYSQRYGTQFALMFIDLDGFKNVNDKYGHLVGDKLLKIVGERLSAIFRDSDTVARYGGDEFLVMASQVKSVDDMRPLAEKTLSSLTDPIFIDSLEIHITGSVGLVFSPRDSDNAVELMKFADRAMYQAKALGKNQYCLHSDITAD